MLFCLSAIWHSPSCISRFLIHFYTIGLSVFLIVVMTTKCFSKPYAHLLVCICMPESPEDRRLEIKLLPHGESNFCGICIILFSLNGLRGTLFICLMSRPFFVAQRPYLESRLYQRIESLLWGAEMGCSLISFSLCVCSNSPTQGRENLELVQEMNTLTYY